MKTTSLESEVNLEEVRKAGINIDPADYDFVYSYPLLASLKPVKDETLTKVLNMQPVGHAALYVHLPFCNYSCTYCYFTKTLNKGLVEDYLNSLEMEIKFISKKFPIESVHSVYIGGGTPTCLQEEQLLKLLRILHNYYDLDFTKEFTCECSPESIDTNKIVILKDYGITRISMGVETFNQQLLGRLCRRHTPEDVSKALELLRANGLKNINIDLIYGFPSCCVEDFLLDLEEVAKLALPSITFYQLWLRQPTPLKLDMGNKSISANEIIALKLLIQNYMDLLGYSQTMGDWFIKNEMYKFLQQEYKWQNNSFLGIGVSAYGFYGRLCYYNKRNLFEYMKAVNSGESAIDSASALNDLELLKRYIVLGIKLNSGFSLTPLENSQDGYFRDRIREKISMLNSLGLCDISNSNVVLTKEGYILADYIAEFFSK